MKPQEVTSVTVSDGFSGIGQGTPVRVKTVRIYIFGQGPFSKDFTADAFTPGNVTQWMQTQVDLLRQIGAIS